MEIFENIKEVLEYAGPVIGSVHVKPFLFLAMSTIIVLLWIVYNLNRKAILKNQELLPITFRRKVVENRIHAIIGVGVSIVGSLFLIALTNTVDNILLVCIVFPFISCLGAVYIDAKFIKDNLWKSDTEDEEEGEDGETGKDEQPLVFSENDDNFMAKISEKISEEDLEKDEFKVIVKNHMNAVQTATLRQKQEYDVLNEKIAKVEELLDVIKDCLMLDKKKEIEEDVYNCLNKQYTTIAQDKDITQKYQIYRRLGGNGEIKRLYEEKYEKLSIKENTPQQN